MYKTEMPRSLHVKSLLQRQMKKRFVPTIEKKNVGATTIPGSINDDGGLHWERTSNQHCLARCLHFHCFTCHKGISGAQGCRLARPAPMNASTGPFQLFEHDVQDNLTDHNPLVDFSYQLSGQKTYCYKSEIIEPPKLMPSVNTAVKPPDDRIICWELRRRELQPLPEIPSQLLDENPLAAKEFRISNFRHALCETDDNTKQTIASFLEWLTEKLTASQVIQIYHETSQELPTPKWHCH